MRARIKMWKSLLLLLCLSGYCSAGPLGFKQRNMPIIQREDEPMIAEPGASDETDAGKPSADTSEMMMMSTLTLPSNATSIRHDITDGFSCENRSYGYYADIENDCQIFHVCLPVTYADGKENTFRWSFICPEETIFSQDSFTCMRPDDMDIDCTESMKYYELNGNFGMPDDESSKNPQQNNNNNNITPLSNEDQAPAATATNVGQQKPIEVEAESAEMASAPVPTQVQPIKQVEKPVKVQKPNRRKPAQKKPAIAAMKPLRKMPQAVPVEKVTVVTSEVKPSVQRFKKRPAATTTAVREKVEPAETETVPVRIEVLHSQRKRPVQSNKKNTAEVKPIENIAVEVPSETNLKTHTTLTNVAPNHESAAITVQLVEKVETEKPKIDTVVASTVDTESQASETAAVFVKPVETVKTTVSEEQTIEEAMMTTPTANEENKASEKQPEEITKLTTEDNIQVNEILPIEVTVNAEDETTNIDLAQNAVPNEHVDQVAAILTEKQNMSAEKSTNHIEIVTSNKPVEAIEEIPTMIMETADNQPILTDKDAVETEDKPKPIVIEEETPSVIVVQPVENVEISENYPKIFEANSEEGAAETPTLEQMEEAKPLDAMEIMPALPEMENQDTIVQHMFEEMDDQKQTMGGFKPVDPAVAAEAEQLITDFLNTLKRGDLLDAKPIVPLEMAEEIQPIVSESQEIQNENKETETKTGEEEKKETETENKPIETVEAKPIEEMQPVELEPMETEKIEMLPQASAPLETAAAATEAEKEVIVAEPVALKNALSPVEFTEQMFQIPVKVIETPVEEVSTAVQLESEPAAQAAVEVTNYKPLSIDDIVELVKERLDQQPSEEKVEAVELPQTPQVVDEKVVAPEDNSNVQEKPVEDTVMPIYHRTTETDANAVPTIDLVDTLSHMPVAEVQNDATKTLATEEKSVQTDSVEPNAVKTDETDAAKVKTDVNADSTKASRSYRSRSLRNAKMDPRKRRFLFRSDAS